MDEMFIELSAALTGFSKVELHGTGVVDVYWQTVQHHEKAIGLLEIWGASQEHKEPLTKLREELGLKHNSDLLQLAQDITMMWYLGQWKGEPISSETYKQGLVWIAINAHTQGAKQQGFGTWSLPPDYLEKNQS